jgi:Xaa-Pro aminopeptidase
MRAVKSTTELAVLQESCRICDVVMAEITASLRPGRTEYEVAAEVDLLAKVHGGRTPSFDTGVFSMGPGDGRDASSRVSAQPLREGLSVSFDFGTVVHGYCSDFGRTIHLGDPGPRYREVYDVVMAAQQAGRRAAIPGATFRDVQAATRAVIEDAGYGQWFRHRTGHCIGLDTHERPFVSEESDWVLAEGMTFTLEPSVFYPGTVGVRVEDIFVCRPGGAVSLNDYSYDLVAV